MTEQEFNNVDNRLELLKFTGQVQSRIKQDITSDFILAKLGDQDKEGITELTGDAYFTKRILQTLKEKAHKWNWNKKTKTWTKTKIPDKDKQKIQKISDTTFDSFMTRIYMTVILNRNVDKNYLVNVITQNNQEEQQQQDEGQVLIKNPKEAIKNEEQL